MRIRFINVRRQRLLGILAGGVASTLLGCANPAMPKPPSLHLPKPAEALTAQRVGDAVKLDWKVSANTTDGTRMKGPITAIVCREDVVAPATANKAKPAKPAPCTPVDRKPVAIGPASAVETLAGINAADPARLVGFRVALENDQGRSSGESVEVLVAGGGAPGPVSGFTATSVRAGVLLRWQGQSDAPKATEVELHRMLLQPAPRPAKAPNPEAKKPAPASQRPAARAKNPSPPMSEESEEILTGDDRADAGGLVDPTVERLARYRYKAQRVRHITVAGHDLVIFGPESAPVELTYEDTFAPAAVTGLAAIAGENSVDLSWESGTDRDLAGYSVYRRDANGAVKKLTPEPEPAPAFRDMTAKPGVVYTYWVTAVDATGNESKPSGEIDGTLP